MKVSYSKGRTINLGNYENVKVDISLELTTDDPEAGYAEAKEFVDAKLAEETGRK